MSVWNGHYQCTCYHPLFVFNQFGDLERCILRPGNVHSAGGWEGVLKPVIVRYRGKVLRIYFRAVCLLKTPNCRDSLEILVPLPYRGRHDHHSVHRHFRRRLSVSSPRLPGDRVDWPATSSERSAAAAPRSGSALLHGPTSLDLALPSLAAGPQRHGGRQAGNRGPVSSGIAKAFGFTGGGDHAVQGGSR